MDPLGITRHDWLDTNGDNALLGIVALGSTPLVFGALAKYNLSPATNTTLGTVFASDVHAMNVVLYIMMIVYSWFLMFTNQFHKWSHQHDPPMFARILMKMNIILTREHHLYHHRFPFDKNYCITNGWCNAFLAKIGYWRFLERIVTLVTGMKPREDDMIWDHLKKQAAKEGTEKKDE